MAIQFSNGYALLVGVGRYKENWLTVHQTAQDAEDIKAILIDPNYCGYPQSQVEVLANESATSTAIIQTLDQLANQIITKQATVVLFFSGHGWDQGGAYYFLAHNAELINNGQQRSVVPETAVSNDDLVIRLRTISQRANKTLVIFNTCFSGGVGTPLAPADEVLQSHLVPIPLSAFDNKLEGLAQGKGTAIFTSSQAGETSWILGLARNSLFVDKLMAAFKGEGVPGIEPTINLLPLIYAVKQSVRETAKQHSLSQDPDYKMYGGMEGDFPIALRLGGKSLSPVAPSLLPPIKEKKMRYNYKAIRELLADTFSPDELDRFLRESNNDHFRKIRRGFGPGMSLDKMIDVVIESCERRLLLDMFLEEVKVYNPAQYNSHAETLYQH